MDKKTSLRISSIALLMHGLMEILGAFILTLAQSEALPKSLGENIVFWATISAIYGVLKSIAGYEVWMMRKWG